MCNKNRDFTDIGSIEYFIIQVYNGNITFTIAGAYDTPREQEESFFLVPADQENKHQYNPAHI